MRELDWFVVFVHCCSILSALPARSAATVWRGLWCSTGIVMNKKNRCFQFVDVFFGEFFRCDVCASDVAPRYRRSSIGDAFLSAV